MPNQGCSTCGTSDPGQFPNGSALPDLPGRAALVLSADRLQRRTRLAAGHVNAWRRLETDLFEIHTHPGLGIGQRALLSRTPPGQHVLPGLYSVAGRCDRNAGSRIGRSRGDRDLASALLFLHAGSGRPLIVPPSACRRRCWVMRPDPAIRHWDGETLEIAQGVTLLRLGGHFARRQVLHWAEGAGGRGALLSGDIVQVAADLSRVLVIWSYRMMPLAAVTVRWIADTLASWRFDRIYGAFPGRQVMAGGARAVERSAARYIELLEGRQSSMANAARGRLPSKSAEAGNATDCKFCCVR